MTFAALPACAPAPALWAKDTICTPNSNELEEYRDNYIVKRIDGRDESVEFLNGLKLYVGNVVGKVKRGPAAPHSDPGDDFVPP